MMRIGYLGAGTWGFCLANLLAKKGYRVRLWTAREQFAEQLQVEREHPKLRGYKAHPDLEVTSDLSRILDGAELLVESVTSKGVRSVCQKVLHLMGGLKVPFVLTSKGIEGGSGKLLYEVVLDVFGEEAKDKVAYISGPGHAEEVIRELPASVVSSAYSSDLMNEVAKIFFTPHFRVYPNSDLPGVAFGGALKNIIAIACGISDGLGFGDSTKAALMTRGLHEIRKLSVVKQCRAETLNGLAGLGDLCVTCLSRFSRNYSFGRLLAEGRSAEQALAEVGMVVEGASTCVAAMELARKADIPVPITEAIYAILYEGMAPIDAVRALLQRSIKEEPL